MSETIGPNALSQAQAQERAAEMYAEHGAHAKAVKYLGDLASGQLRTGYYEDEAPAQAVPHLQVAAEGAQGTLDAHAAAAHKEVTEHLDTYVDTARKEMNDDIAADVVDRDREHLADVAAYDLAGQPKLAAQASRYAADFEERHADILDPAAQPGAELPQ